jgi:two-component system sensor histidine kinase PilS (NtrC family)
MQRNTHLKYSATHQALNIYNYYRIFISLCFLVPLGFDWDVPLLTLHLASPLPIVWIYALLALLIYLWGKMSTQQKTSQIVIPMMLDILFLNFMIQNLNHLESPLSLLFFITIICSSLLLPTRLAIFIAAFLSLTLLFFQTINFFSSWKNTEILHAGLIGFLSFTLAGVISHLTKHLKKQNELVIQKAIELENYEKLSGTIVSMMQVGTIVFDNLDQIMLMNHSAKYLLGISNNTPCHHLKDLPKILVDQFQMAKNTQKETPAFQAPFTPNTIRLSLFQIDTSHKEPFQNYYLVFIHDILKENQQAQRMKLSALGQLSAKIAHEVRNPLGAIQHATQLIKESPLCESKEQRLIEIIQRHVSRVNAVVDSVLSLSRQTSANFHVFDLNEWLHLFVKQFKMPHLEPLSIDLKSSNETFFVTADAQKLEQILINLFENGLYYSNHKNQKSTLLLEIHKEPYQIHLDITDQGPGIPEANIEKIFEPFFTTKQSGSGLGLYIVKELCDLNCIQISIHHNNTQGATFRLSFNRVIGGLNHA